MRAYEFLIEDIAPKIGYHVTRTANLPAIRKNGIKPDRRGNSYVWDTLEMAEWFRDFQNDTDEDRTILKIDVSGLHMTIDDEATDMSEWSSQFEEGFKGGAWIIKGGISPDRIINNLNENTSPSLSYVGNCTEDEIVDDIFGNVSEFARMVEIHGDNFEVGNIVVKYNEEEDIHYFYEHYLKEGFNGGARLIKGGISPDRIINNLNEELILENAPRTLYHGTLKSNLPSIRQRGLEPGIGEFTWNFYDGDPDLEELVFTSSKADINKGLNSIIFYLRQQGIEPTPENIIRYGAMVVVKDEYEQFTHKHYDPDEDELAYDHPYSVEPGDFYSREPVEVAYILQGKKLKDLLRRQGFDAWMGKLHPKFTKQEDIKTQ